jgi:hypothetical protein
MIREDTSSRPRSRPQFFQAGPADGVTMNATERKRFRDNAKIPVRKALKLP